MFQERFGLSTVSSIWEAKYAPLTCAAPNLRRKFLEGAERAANQIVFEDRRSTSVRTAGPVDAALDLAEFHGLINDVDDSVLGIADIDYVGLTQLAEIVRLAAGRRIEGGSIQDDFQAGAWAQGRKESKPAHNL